MKTRMYVIVNQYISGIQAGIQAAHAACRLVHNYSTNVDPDDCRVKLMKQWVTKDETMILLNGGYQKAMYDFTDEFILPIADEIPFTYFHEEQHALNGALTAIAFVLPEKLWNTYVNREGEVIGNEELTPQEKRFVYEFKKMKLKG